MKVIIAGSRGITDPAAVESAVLKALECGWTIDEVVSGTARGVDALGELWAKAHGVPVQSFFPDWDAHGKRAGFVRNEKMAVYADALIAVWDGKSCGTKHMIETMASLRRPVYVHQVSGE